MASINGVTTPETTPDEPPPITRDAIHAEEQLEKVGEIDAEIEKVAAHASAMIDKAETWKARETEKLERSRAFYAGSLQGYLYASGEKTLKLVNGTLKVRAGRQRVEILDEETFRITGKAYARGLLREVPAQFEPDKKAILDWIKANKGEIPDGANLVTGDDTFTVEVNQ